MKPDAYNDGDLDMRFRFAEQTIRFWRTSRETDEQETSLCVHEDSTNVQPQDDRPERPSLRRNTK